MPQLIAEQIQALMPIQPPFLFLDEAVLPDRAWDAASVPHPSFAATARYLIRGDEFFFRGHFKNNPVLPASIMLEALGQLGVLCLLAAFEPGAKPDSIYFASSDGIRCHRVCRPGDKLLLTLKPRRIRPPLATFGGSIHVGEEKAASAEEITLTFAFTP